LFKEKFMESNTNNQSTQRPTQVGPKKKHKANGTTLAIIALSVLLGLSVIFGVTAAFFSASKGAGGDITLGNPVNIDITQGGTSVTSLTFDGTAMPGTTYSQPISVAMPAGTSDAVVRGKLSITNEDATTTDITAVTSTNWVLGEDGYYYYNGKMTASESKDFITSITVPKSLTNTSANKTYVITVQIEAIQYANGAAAEVWTTAPSSWITSYGSGK
jgi:hypothetical protein